MGLAMYHFPQVELVRRCIKMVLAVWCLCLLLPCPARAETFLWEARKGEAMAYLFGSIHMGEPSMFPLDPAVNRAFQQAEALAVEVDVSLEKQLRYAPLILKHTILPDGQTLQDVLSPEGYATVRSVLSQKGLYEQLKHTKPLWVMSTLSSAALQRAGFSPKFGVDEHFLGEARAKQLPIMELETLTLQLTLDEAIPQPVIERVLLESLEELDQVATYARTTIGAWKAGDVEAFASLAFQTRREEPELEPFYTVFFDQRNDAMARKIEGYLDEGKQVFVVVGAGHLAGPNSIQTYLEQRGVTCTQVKAMAPGPPAPALEASTTIAPSPKQDAIAESQAQSPRKTPRNQNFIKLHEDAISFSIFQDATS